MEKFGSCDKIRKLVYHVCYVNAKGVNQLSSNYHSSKPHHQPNP